MLRREHRRILSDDKGADKAEARRRPGAIVRKAVVIALFLCLSIIPLIILGLYPDIVERFDTDSYLGLFVLSFLNASGTVTAGVPIPIPGLLLTFLAARLLNPWYVGVVSGLGAGFGEVFAYPVGAAGRFVVGERKAVILLKSLVDEYGGWIIFIGAVIPNPLFDFWGLTAGLAGFPFPKFIKLVVVARLIRSLIVSLLGYQYGDSLLFAFDG